MATKTIFLLITASTCFTLRLTAMDEVTLKNAIDHGDRSLRDDLETFEKKNKEYKKNQRKIDECIKRIEAAIESLSASVDRLRTLERHASNTPTKIDEVALKKTRVAISRSNNLQEERLLRIKDAIEEQNRMGEAIKGLKASQEATSVALNQLGASREDIPAPTFLEQAKTFAYYILWATWNK